MKTFGEHWKFSVLIKCRWGNSREFPLSGRKMHWYNHRIERTSSCWICNYNWLVITRSRQKKTACVLFIVNLRWIYLQDIPYSYSVHLNSDVWTNQINFRPDIQFLTSNELFSADFLTSQSKPADLKNVLKPLSRFMAVDCILFLGTVMYRTKITIIQKSDF